MHIINLPAFKHTISYEQLEMSVYAGEVTIILAPQ